MDNIKSEILNKICYTDLVYGRINKKLKSSYTKLEIEHFIFKLIQETKENNFMKIGKNYYVSNIENEIRITVNSYTFRIITVDKL